VDEDSSRLLRQYLPKKMELVDEVRCAVEKLSHRPRKVLAGRSPHEVLFGVKMRYTQQALAVALRV